MSSVHDCVEALDEYIQVMIHTMMYVGKRVDVTMEKEEVEDIRKRFDSIRTAMDNCERFLDEYEEAQRQARVESERQGP